MFYWIPSRWYFQHDRICPYSPWWRNPFLKGKMGDPSFFSRIAFYGRLIFIHLQCWEVLPFCSFQRQRCIKIRVLRAQDFYTPLALKTAKGQHLPALEVYKNQSPILIKEGSWAICIKKGGSPFFFCPLFSFGWLPIPKRRWEVHWVLAWPSLQSLAVKKNFFLCKFWAVKNF